MGTGMESIYSSCWVEGLIYGDDDLKPSTLCQAKENMEEERGKKRGMKSGGVGSEDPLDVFIQIGCVCFGFWQRMRRCRHEILIRSVFEKGALFLHGSCLFG